MKIRKRIYNSRGKEYDEYYLSESANKYANRIYRKSNLHAFKSFWNRIEQNYKSTKITSPTGKTYYKTLPQYLEEERSNIRRLKRKKSLTFFRQFWNRFDPIEIHMLEIKKNLDMDMINGLLLGDACISIQENRNGRFSLIQAKKTEQLVLTAAYHFADIGLHYNYMERKPSNVQRYGKFSKCNAQNSCRIQSGNSKIFTEMREKWYPFGKKIVPKDIELNAKLCAFWFMTDGSSIWQRNRKDLRVHVTFYTDGFSLEDCNFLLQKLKDIGFEHSYLGNHHTKNHWTIHIGRQKEVYTFMKMVEPYIIQCFDYKLKIPNISTLQCKHNTTANICKKCNELMVIK